MKQAFLRNDDESREEIREALDYLNGEAKEESAPQTETVKAER